MVLDEPRNGDKRIDHNGISFVIAQEFFDRVKPVAIDFNTAPNSSAFSISSVAYNFSLRVLL
jgi:Fe-S cluster assembly iron-binding protein IscA